jgi:hypothetical protein
MLFYVLCYFVEFMFQSKKIFFCLQAGPPSFIRWNKHFMKGNEILLLFFQGDGIEATLNEHSQV